MFLNRQKKLIGAIGVIALALTAVVLFRPQSLGLATLPTSEQKTEPEKENPKTQNAEQKISVAYANPVVSKLSFEVLKQTSLTAEVFNDAKTCPKQSEIEISVSNTGSFKAEKVFATINNFEIESCENCEIDLLLENETKKIFVSGCKKENKNAMIEISSVNAPTKIVYAN